MSDMIVVPDNGQSLFNLNYEQQRAAMELAHDNWKTLQRIGIHFEFGIYNIGKMVGAVRVKVR
jgi:hypothetical protein